MPRSLSILAISCILFGGLELYADSLSIPHLAQKPWANQILSEKDYLKALLKELKIAEESQVLVFSKTSHQIAKIHPRAPRAIYFNEDYYVGYVQDGLLEIIEIDPVEGARFYTLERPAVASQKPVIVEDASCLSCHESHHDFEVPGLMVRSVYADSNGQAILNLGTFRTKTGSPLKERWGGWWVTGKLAPSEHMGNRIFSEKDRSPMQTFLSRDVVDWSEYLRTTSDVLALMLLEHQSEFHNQLAMSRRDVLEALTRDQAWREAMKGKVDGEVNPILNRIVQDRAAQLLRVMLFKDEAELPEDGIQGDADYEAAFLKNVVRSNNGRSLRDLQLNDRLFKHRCSYMIYTESFKQLPPLLLAEVTRQLEVALLGENPDYEYLPQRERERISEILLETAPYLKFSKLKAN